MCESDEPRFLLACLDAHKLPILWSFLLELHVAIALRVQGVIPANTDIGASMKSRATLTYQNVACNNRLATKRLDAEAFGFGVATVLTTTACFFMCHFKYLSSLRPLFWRTSLIQCQTLFGFLGCLLLGRFLGCCFLARSLLRCCLFRGRLLGRWFLGGRFLGRCFLGGRFLGGRLHLSILCWRRSGFTRPADAGDLDLGKKLPVRVLAKIVLAPPEFDDADLLAFALPQDFCTDTAAGEQGAANLDFAALAHEQDLVKLDVCSLAGIELLKLQYLTFARPVLLAT